jgi:hypothetical protein
MKDERKLTRIDLYFSDGSRVELYQEQLERLYALKDMVNLLETAKFVYDQLERLFGKQ